MQFKSGSITGHINFLDMLVRFLGGYADYTTPVFTGTGTGVMQYVDTLPGTVTETWTVTCTTAAANGGTFSVVGSVSGAQANATVGVDYANAFVKFIILDGATDFIVSDYFTFTTTAGLMDSSERWEVLRYNGVDLIDASSYTVNFEPWVAIKGPYGEHPYSWKTALGQANNSWISFRFSRPLEFTKMILSGPTALPNTPGIAPLLTQGPRDFNLEWSDDGVNWNIRQTWTGITWTFTGGGNGPAIAPVPQEFVLSGVSPGPKRYWRIFVTVNNGSTDFTELSRIQCITVESFIDYNWATRPVANLKAPGMTGLDPVYVNFQIYDRPTNDVYNIGVTAANGFTSSTKFDDQPGALAGMAIPMWDQPVQYWINANGQRVVIGMKISTSTLCTYVGKILTFGLPTQYPYPVLVAAPLKTCTQTKYTDPLVTMPFKGNRDNMKLRTIDGTWINPLAWPYSISANYTFRDTNGDYPLLPITLYSTTAGNTYGTLDGVDHITGFDNAAENTVTVGAETYLVLQDVTRSGVSDMHTMRIA